MNTTLESVKDSTLIRKRPVRSPFSYRVVCERCHRTIFFYGDDDVEPVAILCDKCSLDDWFGK